MSNEYVIRGGQVLTIDKAIADLPNGDVHVKDGIIIAVAEHIEAPGATIVDANDMIVMPGFVDTHSHLWNAFLRGSVRAMDEVRSYFPTTNRASALCTPEHSNTSVRLGLMEGLLSGITCVNNFSHNTRSPEHADAEINGALEVGVRTRFSHGGPGRGARLNLEDVEQMVAKWSHANPLLTLGVNLQPPKPQILTSGENDPVFVAEVEAAQRLGLPISYHYGSAAHGLIKFLNDRGMLNSDTLMVHPLGFTAWERETMTAAGVQHSISPAIEIPFMSVRDGYIQFDELERLGADISLSVDAAAGAATADSFLLMRGLVWAHMQRTDVESRYIDPRRVVEIATLGGAKALGLDDRIGSLTPGKEADIILVRKNDINMVPVIDPYESLILSGSPANVDTVMVGGEILLRRGVHRSLDVAEVADRALRAGLEMHPRLEEIIAQEDYLPTKEANLERAH